jgi:hypothetical protein
MNFDHSMYGHTPADLNITGNKIHKEEGGKSVTVRAKSVENKRRQLLAATIKFQRRLNLIKKRRAQYFAPTVKLIDADIAEKDRQYDEYVFNKLKIKIDPDMIDET